MPDGIMHFKPDMALTEVAPLIPTAAVRLVKFYRELGWKSCKMVDTVPAILAEVTVDMLPALAAEWSVTRKALQDTEPKPLPAVVELPA